MEFRCTDLDLIRDLEGVVLEAEASVIQRGIRVFCRKHPLNVGLLVLLSELELIIGLTIVPFILHVVAVRVSGPGGSSPKSKLRTQPILETAAFPS